MPNNNNNNSNWQKLTNIYANIRAGRNLNRWSNSNLIMYLVMHPTPEMRAGRKIYVKNRNTGKYVRTNKPNKPITRKRILKNIKRFG